MSLLFPNAPFNSGQVLTPELADLAFEAPIFDGQTQYKGHREKIRDDELSDEAGSVKSKVGFISDNLLVTAQSGLTVRCAPGVVKKTNGELLELDEQFISLTDNQTAFIWLRPDGLLQQGSSNAPVRLLLAKYTTASGSIVSLTDLRNTSTPAIFPVGNSIRSFGGVSTNDKTCFNGEILTGVYYLRNFTVPSGVSVTADRFVRIFCSGGVNIHGLINVTPCTRGAQTYGIFVIGVAGGYPGYGIGGGGGNDSSPIIPYQAQPFGSGGSGGSYSSSTGTTGYSVTSGGAGGGCLWIEAAGDMDISGHILADGTSGANAASLGSSDVVLTGGGGGSGGLIYLASLGTINLNPTNTILSVRGGSGGNAAKGSGTSSNGYGGGGGGGGYIVLAAPSLVFGGASLLRNGGAAGTSTAPGFAGGVGGSYGGRGGSALANAGELGQFITIGFTPLS